MRKLHIDHTWDGEPVQHAGIDIELMTESAKALKVKVMAPFFNDPQNPGGETGKPFQGLWDYEVVEVFFLNDKNQYLEVELCPHGQHIVLMLSSYRQCFKDMLPLDYTCSIQDSTWVGEATIPGGYLPPQITKVNAYGIHGTGEKRQYEALYPAEKGAHEQPDFHRLEYFQEIDFKSLLPSNWDNTKYLSDYWK